MSNQSQIFQTANPSRWKKVKWTFRVLLFITVFLIVVVTLAVINGRNPSLPNLLDKSKFYQSKLDPASKLTFTTAQNKKYKGFKDLLEKRKQEKITPGNNTVPSSLIRSGFYTPWSVTALPDLKKNADKLNTVYPEWFFIDTTTYTLQTRIDSAGLIVMKQNNLSIQPIFNNFHTYKAADGRDSGYFDPKLVHTILNNTEKRKHIIQQIVDTLTHYQLQGLNVDFEELNEDTNEPLTLFQKELYETLHAKNLTVTMDVSPDNEDYDYKSLSAYNDYVILMAYDEFNDNTKPGPISSQKWIEKQLDKMDDNIDASKIILGVAGYARDWINEENEDGKRVLRVDDITYNNAIDNAKLANATIDFNNDTYNLHYTYTTKETDSSSETTHSVWFTDAATTFNILRFSDDYKTAGTALWHIGGEDQRIWQFYNRDLSIASLQNKPFDFNSISIIPIDFNAKPT